ncbi:hypothetical protein FN976_10960 [Caenimonas sedimenti]|uniref:Bacterial type II secretion system protein E domain-containing protein n=1 Tax=Caenimonas sedimenti TaxID=2596921 RepID=A0A562ZS58_9BURK|nr:ATPase, T2SS/T4P/T4SS family [Caenimonas sedimenti]TWO71430.1 hypothetical protein FN976_10960 [Caenimonas sedimenti]
MDFSGFFTSRRRPTESEVDRVRAKTARLAPAPALRIEGGGLHGEFADTVTGTVDEEIIDMRDLPSGKFVTMAEMGLDSMWQSKLAIIQTSEVAFLLVTPAAYSRPAMFETMKRLKASNRAVNVKRISKQLLEAVVERHVKDSRATAGPDTEVEVDAKDLIRRALELRTSDVHIEARSEYAEVKFRIAGKLIDQPQISQNAAHNLCSVLYNNHADSGSKGVSWTHETVLDTSIDWKLEVQGQMKSVQIRFSSGPIHPQGNFHAVMRLLTMEAAEVPLKDVGYTPGQYRAIERGLIGAQGLVLLVGPTNSGKSTSMQAMLSRTRERRGNIKTITIEKPVEYLIPGACQMPVADDRDGIAKKGDGSIYNAFIKGTLRQDPDVVMVGEIRDHEEAASVKNLVIAGRKLFTTLHVFKATAVFERLRQLGVPEDVLYMEGFISVVIFQRLVPNLCDCALPWDEAVANGYIDDEDLIERVHRISEPHHNVRYRNPAGCAHCRGTGTKGRSICAEVLVPDEDFLGYLRAGNRLAALAHWFQDQELSIDGLGPTAICHAISKIRNGIHDPRDVEEQVTELAIPRVQASSPAAASEQRPFRMGRSN